MTTSIKDLICSAETVGTNGIGAVIDPNFVYDKTKYKAKIVYPSSTYTWIPKTSGATPRYWHSAIYYNNGVNNLMIIFGGSNFLNDVWEYNLDTDVWTQKTSGATPRYKHSAIYYNNGVNNLMVIFGGYDGTNYLNDIWEYNLDTDIWSQKISGATVRDLHSAIYYNNGINNLMVIFGGYDGTNYLNDIWEYNLDTDTWSQKISGTPVRCMHSAIYYNDSINNLMVIFGGYNGDVLNNVWEYNLDTDVWTQKTSGATPRYKHSTIYYNNGINDFMVIFSGFYAINAYSSAIYEYNLNADKIWRILYPIIN